MSLSKRSSERHREVAPHGLMMTSQWEIEDVEPVAWTSDESRSVGGDVV